MHLPATGGYKLKYYMVMVRISVFTWHMQITGNTAYITNYTYALCHYGQELAQVSDVVQC